MKKLFKKLLRDRKGISIAEVMVAMAMVLIITGAAIAVVTASIQSDAKFIAKYDTLTACENAVECVRYSTDISVLETALTQTGLGFVISEDDKYDGDNQYTFTYESGNDTVTVTVTYDAESDFEKCVVNYNDETIYLRKQ